MTPNQLYVLKAIRKALHDAYPWCSRDGFPYKVWCSEIQSQRGTYKTKGQRNQESLHRLVNQGELFLAEELPKIGAKTE